jgi:hypothetical protein
VPQHLLEINYQQRIASSASEIAYLIINFVMNHMHYFTVISIVLKRRSRSYSLANISSGRPVI